MELKDFVELLVKRWKLVILVTVVCTVAAVVVTYILPVKYQSSIDVYVKRLPSNQTGDFYTYDGYYSVQSSVQYTDTVAGFFQSLHVVQKAAENVEADRDYEKGEKDPDILAEDVDYLEGVAGKVIVENLAPQVLQASYTNTDKVKSEMWIKYLGEEVVQTVSELSSGGDNEYQVTVSEFPLTKEVTPSLILNSIVGLVAGMTLGVTGAFLPHYFKED